MKFKGYFEKRVYSGEFLEIFRYTLSEQKRERSIKANESSAKQKKYNEKNATRKLMRLMHCNFEHGEDLYVTTTFKPSSLARRNEKIARKEFAKFIRKLKHFRIKNNLGELKYIASMGETEGTGIHFHMCINKMSIKDVKKIWKHSEHAGRIKAEALKFDNENGLHDLAEYFVRQKTKRIIDMLKTESVAENKKRLLKNWSSSKHLKKPKIIKKRIKRLYLLEQPKEIKKFRITCVTNEYNEFTGAYQYIQLKLLE